MSPFEADGTTVSASGRRSNRGRAVWIGSGALLVAVLGVAGLALSRYMSDPLRTFEPFPVSEYLQDYRPLAGSRFRGDLRVEADLGWKENAGRLMLFSTVDEPRPVAALVPAVLGKQIHFTKGQEYVAELEVKEGGLIYVNNCRKK